MVWGLFREFPSQNQFDPVSFFLSLSVDFVSWFVVLLAVSKLMHALWGTEASQETYRDEQ